MQIDPPAQVTRFDDSPAPTAGRIMFVLTRPREGKTGRTAALFYAAVNISRYQAELELSRPLRVDLDVSGHFHIDIIPVPHLHLRDAPIPHERFHLLHRMSFKNLPLYRSLTSAPKIASLLSYPCHHSRRDFVARGLPPCCASHCRPLSVRRYFCRRLLGLSGMVISIRPSSKAGLR